MKQKEDFKKGLLYAQEIWKAKWKKEAHKKTLMGSRPHKVLPKERA